ncbi:hypothetical protein [Sinorhizobium fredii]|uniref:hypothetical protein n=1 Tax=Rhizobium fredii TaxID=380 RepID=UPI003517A39A
MKQLAQFLNATGRRLRSFFTKIVSHLFRKGKLALKLAVKVPFFIEVEISFETDWDKTRRR